MHAYVAWTQRPCEVEETYPRFEGLSPVVLNLLEGVRSPFPLSPWLASDLNFSAFASPPYNALLLARSGKTQLFSALRWVRLTTGSNNKD